MVDFAEVTVVIPTARDELITPDTVPASAELIIRRDDGLNVARNAGVREATNDWVVIADDDIEFPADLVSDTIDVIDRQTLAGLEDFPPLRWVIGRLLIFHRDLWETVGGFDERRHHGGDTDFAIRVEKHGGTIRRLDRLAIPHHDEDTGLSMPATAHLEWVLYLLRRHPVQFTPVAMRLVARRLVQ